MMADESQDKPAEALEPRSQYRVYVRLPFPRGGFVDPPLIDWDASKDEVLWKTLARNPKTSDTNWKELAERFGVTVDFILKQAAWLYQRHLADMKLQMQAISQSAAPQPPSISSDAGTHPAAEVFAKEEIAEASTRLDIVEDTLTTTSRLAARSRGNSLQQTRPLLGSRNPSTNTITQSKIGGLSSAGKLGTRPSRGSLGSSPRQRPPPSRETPSRLSGDHRNHRSSLDESSDDSSSEDAASRSHLGRSQMFQRAPRFSAARTGKQRARDSSNETDNEEEPTFFTFSKPEEQGKQDLGATVRHPQSQPSVARQPIEVTKVTSAGNTDSSVSSAASSAAPVTSFRGTVGSDPKRPGPLSPRQRAQLAEASPRGQASGGRSGSEGTPSMGSSFSDLGDFSGTQSALEDALMSQIQRAGVGSRFSNLGDAPRSSPGPGAGR